MPTVLRKYGMILWLVLLAADCKKPYTPPAILGPNNYLVVDGVINTGPGAITTINLNRTRNLNDTVTTGIPELGAQLSIVDLNGNAYPLTDVAGNGLYTSTPLTLDPAGQYKIEITTADSKNYTSAYLTPKATPPIDSIFYEQPDNFTLFLTTHDPANNTRYYRWDYLQTWEHDSRYQTPWELRNGQVWAKEPDSGSQQRDRCWTTTLSNTILLGNTTALSQDLVDKMPIISMVNNDLRLDIGYYILVRQYALTKEAYDYWQLIQKTSQQVGTLFDLQPTQLAGNITCTSDPNVPVIGYMSASSVQQAHLYIINSQLNGWGHYVYLEGCPTHEARRLSADDFHSWLYPDTAYAPYYFQTNGPLIVAPKRCLDCEYQGGTNVKPSFWP